MNKDIDQDSVKDFEEFVKSSYFNNKNIDNNSNKDSDKINEYIANIDNISDDITVNSKDDITEISNNNIIKSNINFNTFNQNIISKDISLKNENNHEEFNTKDNKGILINLVDENESNNKRKEVILEKLKRKRELDQIKIEKARKNNNYLPKQRPQTTSKYNNNNARINNNSPKIIKHKVNKDTPKSSINISKISNKKVIQNSIIQVLLPGPQNHKKKTEIFQEIEHSCKQNFVIVFKQIGRIELLAVYYFTTDTEAKKIISYGICPEIISSKHVYLNFKYASGSKDFKEIEDHKDFNIYVDAVILKQKYYKKVVN